MVDRPDRPFRLDTSFVKNVTETGRYSDGPGAYGLSLLVRATAWGGLTRRFQQRVTIDGRRTNLALGSFPLVTLAQARELAFDNARSLSKGATLPVQGERQREAAPAPTFREVSEMFVAANADAWRRAKTLTDWRSRLEAYALPALGGLPVDMVTTADVLDVLTPHWTAKHATMGKVAQALSSVFAFGIARGLCSVDPANGKVLASALPRVGKVATHFEALPHEAVLDALLAVQQADTSDAVKLCFEWTALTACRSGEARGATWAEIDGNEWTIPAARMKQARPHRVPLSREALDVLRRAERIRDGSGLLFPSTQGGQIHGSTLTRALRNLGIAGTIHGMRSSFRDWAAHEGVDHVLAELALAHVVGNATERAYLRSDLVQQRREVMERWAVVVCGEEAFYTP